MSSKNILVKTPFNERVRYVINIIKKQNMLTQNSIAKRIGISGAALSDLLSGKSKSAAGTTLKALEVEFGVNPEWLTKEKGDPFHFGMGVPVVEPFGTSSTIAISHLKEIVDEKSERIKLLESLVEGLKADKERLIAENNELKREITDLEKGKTGS